MNARASASLEETLDLIEDQAHAIRHTATSLYVGGGEIFDKNQIV